MAKKETEETKKLTSIIEKIQSSESFLKNYQDNWERYYKLYRSYIDDDKWATKTKVFNPYVYSAIETHTSKSVNQKPDGEYVPANPESQGDTEKLGLAFDEWWRLDRATIKGQQAFKKGLMYGSAMFRVLWKFRTGFIAGQKQIVDDRPTVRINRLEDGMCGFDPEADSWENVRYAWEKYYVTKADINDWLDSKNISGNAFDKKKLKEALDKFDTISEKDNNQYRKNKLNVNEGNLQDNNISKVECIYFEDYETGKVQYILGRKYIVQDAYNTNPFERSFGLVVDTIVPSEVLGMGEIEPVERLQHGLNLVQNQRRDAVAQNLKNQWLVGDKAEVDDDELVDDLGGIIHVAEINEIKPLIKQDITGNAFQEELTYKQDIQSALAITDASKGNTGSLETQKSGRALELLQSAADARVQVKLQNFEVMFIKEVAEKWQRLASIHQRETMIVMQGGEPVEIAPEEFQGEYNYFVESGSTTHTDKTRAKEEYIAYQKEIINLAQLKQNSVMAANPTPQVDQKTGQPLPVNPVKPLLNYDKLAEKLSEKFNVKDWREIWLIEEPVSTDLGEQLPVMELGERQTNYGDGEMLPSIDDESTLNPNPQSFNQPNGEMLPSIDDEMMSPNQPNGEMLPPID